MRRFGRCPRRSPGVGRKERKEDDGVDDTEYAALIAILQKMLKNIRKHDS